MQKTKLAKANDYASIFILFFIALFIVLLRLTNNLLVSSILSAVFSLLLLRLLINEVKKRQSTKQLKKDEENKAIEILNAFKTAMPSSTKNFFMRALNKKYKTESTQSGILITLPSKTILFAFNFLLSELQIHNLMELIEYSKHKSYTLYYLGESFSTDAMQLNRKYSHIRLIDYKETYLICKHLNTFPKIESEIKNKNSFFSKLKNSIERIHFYRYLKLGLILLVLGFLLPGFSYFRPVSIFFIFLSFISLFSKRKLANETPLEFFK